MPFREESGEGGLVRFSSICGSTKELLRAVGLP